MVGIPGVLLLALVAGLPPNDITTVDKPVGSVGATSIGADGRPVITYGRDGALMLARCGNPACTTGNTLVTLDGATDGNGASHIAIPPDGLPVVSYADVTTTVTVKLLKCGNPACTSGNTVATIGNGWPNAVAVGADGLPVIAYKDAAILGLKVAKCGNPACTAGTVITTVDPTSQVGDAPTVVIGADALPVISYLDGDAFSLKVAKCGTPGCTAGNTVTTVDDPLDQLHNYTSIAIGADGLPVIGYWAVGDGAVKVAKCGDPACTAGNSLTTVDGSPNNVVASPSIAVGPDGLPVVSYWNVSARTLRVAKCGNSGCTAGNTLVTVDDPPGLVGAGTSIAIGFDGLPVISYFDDTASALKVAKCGTPACQGVSQPPVLAAVGNRSVAEGANLSFQISASDPDAGDVLTYAASSLPPGATFDDATGTFAWTPTFTQAGAYTDVRFVVADGHGGYDFEDITITVTNTNRPPELHPIGDQSGIEGTFLGFTLYFTDPDLDRFTFSASSLPPGATLDPLSGGFSWVPGYTQAGVYPGVRFEVRDDQGGSDFEIITITIAETLVSPRGDFNGDSRPDLVWRHDVSDQDVVWFMNGVNLASGTFMNPPVLADHRWRIVGTNDFNRDGKMDLLWRHTQSGENVVWFLNGIDLVSGTFTTPAALGDVRWQMVGTGDFNGDALPDILWRHDVSGESVVWYMSETVLTGGTFLTPALADVGWRMAGVADFDRDGPPDILWHHSVSGEAVLWYMNNAELKFGTFTTPNG
jgi:hypothetical protein